MESYPLNQSNFLDFVLLCFIIITLFTTIDVLLNTFLSWDPYQALQDIFGEISVDIFQGFLRKE